MNFKSNIRPVRRVRFSPGKPVLFFALAFFFSISNITLVSAQTEDNAIKADNNSNPAQSQSEPAPLAFDGNALLPEVGPSTDAPETISNPNDLASVYTVRKGDTLASVADMFGISVNTILWANGLAKGSTLKVGQTLDILPISGVVHTVVAGDTLNSIAKKYGGDINDILSFNDLSLTDKLTVGDTILIPDGEASYSVSNTAGSGTSARGKLYEPLLVNVASLPSYPGYYAQPFLVGHKTQGLHGHNAVDYGMPVGSPIYAAAAGTVIISKSSGWNGGYGEYVVIQHPNGTQTWYGHMSKPLVYVGQVVTQGQLIGESGNTGNSTGPHLHFEVRGAQNPF